MTTINNKTFSDYDINPKNNVLDEKEAAQARKDGYTWAKAGMSQLIFDFNARVPIQETLAQNNMDRKHSEFIDYLGNAFSSTKSYSKDVAHKKLKNWEVAQKQFASVVADKLQSTLGIPYDISTFSDAEIVTLYELLNTKGITVELVKKCLSELKHKSYEG